MSSAAVMYDHEAHAPEHGAPRHPTPYLLPLDDSPAVPPAILQLVAQVEELALLPPDWDGRFSSRVDPGAIERARWFVEHLRVPWLPLVGATSVGGVRIEWDARVSSLMIDFEPDGDTQVLFMAREGDPQVWRNAEIPDQLVEFFNEVYKARQEF